MELESSQNPKIKFAKKVIKNASFREKENLFALEGYRFIKDIINTRPELIKFVLIAMENSDNKNEKLIELNIKLNKKSIPTYKTQAKLLQNISNLKNSSGIISILHKPDWNIENILADFKNIIILDQVQSPSNLGAIVRNAVAFNIDAVLYTPGTVDPFHPESIRAMAGNIFQIPVLECKDDLFQHLEKQNPGIYILDSQTGTPLNKFKPDHRNIFIFGSEGDGLKSEFIKSKALKKIKIEMSKNIDSLNVAVSSGILLYQLSFLR